MRILSPAALAVPLLAHWTWAVAQANDDPVCIVGAGPAGLSAAHALETSGYQVVVFEKQPEVGGKCQAYYENGLFHPLGALLLFNNTEPNTLEIIASTNVTAAPLNELAQPGWLYNWTTGEVLPERETIDIQSRLAQEVPRYLAWWEENFAPHLVSAGYKAGVPQALTVPTAQWLREEGYQALSVVFNEVMVTYGYGDIRETPILYLLQFFCPEVLGFITGASLANLIDFHEVFVQYARNVIKGSIFTNTTVTRVDRSGSLPVLTYSGNVAATPVNQTCSSVIMAFPPTLSALKTAGVTLSVNESEVFTAVQTTNYFSGAVRLSEVPSLQSYTVLGEAANLPPSVNGEPVAFISLQKTSNVASIWSWGGKNDTYQDAYGILKEVLTKLNKDPEDLVASGLAVTNADVKAFVQLEGYFARFGQEALAGGWYAKFDELQGQQNTYWASGLNMFEAVEFSVRSGLDIVSSYF